MISSSVLSRQLARGVSGVSRHFHAKALPAVFGRFRAASPHDLSTGRPTTTFTTAPTAISLRSFSSNDSSSVAAAFTPERLTAEMAQGIADATHFYIRHGLAQRRLQALAQDSTNNTSSSVLGQWQAMIEIYLATQLHVLAGMGYADTGNNPQEHGLAQYAQDLATLLGDADDETRDAIIATRRESWRELVATAYGFDADTDIPTLSVVQARELMHAVSSRMVQPDLLMMVQQQTAKLSDPNPEVDLQMKHHVLQEVIVNQVYLGQDGGSSITEQFGFGTGPQAYAKLQCAMSDHEGDPLIGQYAASAMTKLFKAAGLENLLDGSG